MHLKNGAVLQGGRYRIEKLLGQGGFGITYLAIQSGLNRKVAIKEFFMKDLCNRDADTSHVSVPSIGSRDLVEKFKVKFLKEAAIIAAMDNDHIVRIHDIFEENGTAYYVMEYLGEDNLQSRIPASGMPYQEAVGYIRQIAAALGYIHSQNILHLDIKPSNVLFRKGTDAVLIDFGVSKHYDGEGGSQTSSTPVGLSRGYAPLEQNKAGGVSQFTPSTDIYSLGATFYKLITGQTPPEADDVYEDGLPAFPSSVPSEIAYVIEKSMQPKRKDRPQSINEFLEILDSALEALQVRLATRPSRPDPVVLQPEDSGPIVLQSDNPEPDSIDNPVDDKTTLGKGADLRPANSSGSTSEPSSQTQYTSPKKKSRKWLKWLLAMCVALICIAALMFMGKDAQPSGSSENLSSLNKSVGTSLYIPSQTEADQAKNDALNYADLMWKGSQYEQFDVTLNQAKDLYSEARLLEEKWSKFQDYASLFSQDAAGALKRVENKLIKLQENASTSFDHPGKPSDDVASDAKKKDAEGTMDKAAQTVSHNGTHNGHQWVDLGLPSGLKWAVFNVGVSNPGTSRNYYAWGETTHKSEYMSSASSGKSWGDIGGNSSRDAATANWGSGWRMPTKEEFQELMDNCTWEWTTQGAYKGYKVTSKKNTGSIFFPASGYRDGNSLYIDGELGYYWTSTPDENNTDKAYYLFFTSGYQGVYSLGRYRGVNVRPVLDQ